MPEWVAALLGVFVGFLLHEGATVFRTNTSARRYRAALLDEIDSVLS
jgi:hypothetical protein